MIKILGKIPIADIILTAIIIFLVFAAVQFSVPRAAYAQGGNTVIEYTIELGDFWYNNQRRLVYEGFNENVHIGAQVFDSQRGIFIGEVVDVYALPLQVQAPDIQAGVIRQASVYGLELTRIVIRSVAEVCDYETLIGLFPVSVGREAYIRSKNFAGAGHIISVEVVSN